MKNFINKVAIITGGGAGIGKALCYKLAKLGATVVVADIREDYPKQVADDITNNGGRANYMQVDVSCETDVQQLVDYAALKYGKIDYMFNNAGIAIGGDVRDLTLEQ